MAHWTLLLFTQRASDVGVVQIVELEACREALHNEIANMQRRLDVADDEANQRARDHQTVVEDNARAISQAADQRRYLESSLEVANAELGNLRNELSAAHGRVEGLEDQLARSESARRDGELKLGSVVSIIRRSIGGFGGLEKRDRSRSPERRSPSPAKGN